VVAPGILEQAREGITSTLRRLIPDEPQHMLVVTIVTGLACGLVAVAFHLAIQVAERRLVGGALAREGWQRLALLVLSPAAGGLVAGALLAWVVPGARGSGIPQVKQVYALGDGRVPVRDALGKFVVGTLQIGSGASLGREGPTVQICAGASTLIARLTALPARNMRRLLPVASAAGIAAAFNAPIAAVTFTIEEIVGSLDQSVLSGAVVAAALAAVIERSVLGVHPVIEAPQGFGLDHASSFAFFALLGVLAAGVSVAFTDGLLELRLRFRRQRLIPPWAQPSVGGLVTGLLAAVVMLGLGVTGVNGGGYEMLGPALEGRLALGALLTLCVTKLAATVFSYSSGGAGGIFMPALFVGAMLGGAVGHLDVSALAHEPRQLGAFALVGMGAVFAGVIRAPITSVLIIFEMTGAYGLILPLMLANVTAFVLARRARPTPIYEALLEQDGVVLPRPAPHRVELEHPSRGPLAKDLARPLVEVPAGTSVADALDRLAGGGGVLVRPGNGVLLALPVEDLRAIAAQMPLALVKEEAEAYPEAGPGLDVSELVTRLVEDEVDAILVTDPSGAVHGLITRAELAAELLEHHARGHPRTSPR